MELLHSSKPKENLLNLFLSSPLGRAHFTNDRHDDLSRNGVAFTILRHSKTAGKTPDTCLLAIPGAFPDYRVGGGPDPRAGSIKWIIRVVPKHLQAGQLTLPSLEPPLTDIHFRLFDESGGDYQEDLHALNEGIQSVRSIMMRTGKLNTLEWSDGTPITFEDIPKALFTHTRPIQACGTCRMGPVSFDNTCPPDDRAVVVDSDFRVYGIANLRIVDASVLPESPGFSLTTAVYLLGEKAADVIIRDSRRTK